MRVYRRLGLFTLFTLALLGAGYWSGKWFPHSSTLADKNSSVPAIVSLDSSEISSIRKQCPWLFKNPAFDPYRSTLILPLLREMGGGIRSLKQSLGVVELVYPKGQPLYEWAWHLESLCQRAGIKVMEGREFTPLGQKALYQLQASSGPPLALRIVQGNSIRAGATRMALVLVGLGKVDGLELQNLLAFPMPMTLVVPAGDSIPASVRWGQLPKFKETLLELPMEPFAYPYLNPGNGAIFIHHSKTEVEQLIRIKLQRLPQAKGFATTFGDRAIENRPLLENILGFLAEQSMLFLDLTGSPRSLTASVAQKTGVQSYSIRIKETPNLKILESELARNCALAEKAGERIWVLSYSPSLLSNLTLLLEEHQAQFEEAGLEWVTFSSLRKRSK